MDDNITKIETDDGVEDIEDAPIYFQDVKNEAEPVENYEKVGDVPEVEPPKTEEGMDAPPQPKKNKVDEENVFTDEEDLNDIDSILKRQQKKAPEPEVDNMIIN